MMIQGCALVAPSCPRCLTFAPEKLKNYSFFFIYIEIICRAP